MKLVVIRHLQTQWNLEGRLQGRHDQPVLQPDDATESQIQKNRTFICTQGPFDAVLVSSLQRTQQTALHYGYEVFDVEPLLSELDFGRFEGRLRLEMLRSLEPAWTRDPRRLVLGERIVDFESRIKAFLHKYRDVERLLAFGHGSWCRGVLSISRHGDLRGLNEVTIPNNGVLRVMV